MYMSENEHFSKTGLALTDQELRGLEAGGWEFTGWYNMHSQPVVRNKKTGEELSYCRMGYEMSRSNVCNVYVNYSQEARR